MSSKHLALAALLVLAAAGCRGTSPAHDDAPKQGAPSTKAVGTDPGHAGAGTPLTPRAGHALAAFAAGCFWGVEDGFRKVAGVTATTVGYTGGHTENPTYESVCTHGTGHAETVLVEFDPQVVSYDKLLRVFFAIHDPTQVDQQGPDVGDQYRSEVFVFDDAQETAAKAAREAARKQHGSVATRISRLGKFWIAEGYHQQYAEKNGSHGCAVKVPESI